MKIVLGSEVVGELTDDGEIMTEDVWLKKLRTAIKHHKLEDLRSKKGKEGLYFYVVKLQKGDAGYYSTVANILLDKGYGLEE